MLSGRVGACENVNICYDTFLDWFKKKPEFSEAIKKAEDEMNVKGKQIAIQSIFKAMQSGQWTAAAWWLERNYPKEYVVKQNIEHSGNLIINFRKQDEKL
jgi:hypothetical protein